MNRTFLLTITALLFSAIYFISLHAPFIYDDVDQILFNAKLHSLSPLLNVIFCDFRQIRVISNLSYAWNWWLSGGSTWSFHLTNIVIHFVNTFLVWCILDKVLSNQEDDSLQKRSFLRDFTVFLFLIHPIQSEAVSYITGRTSLLQASGFLIVLFVFMSEKRKPALVAALIALSLLFKESCALIPVLLLGYELTLGKKTVNWKEFALYFGSSLLIIPLYFVLKDPQSMYDGTVGFSFYPLGTYWMWQFRYYLFYFWLFVSPGSQSIVHNPPNLSAIVIIAGFFGAVTYFGAVWFAWRKRLEFPVAAFLIFLFLIPLIPTNTFVQMINPFAEYRFYLSNLSTCFLFSWLLWKLRQLIKLEFLRKTVVVSISAFFLISSIRQQITWSDDRSLFSKAVENYPDYYRTHLLLGGAYEEKGDLNSAKQQYLDAMNLVKTVERVKTYRPWMLLARIDLKQGNYKECVSVLDSIKIETIQGMKIPLVYYQTYLFALAKLNDRKSFEKLQKRALSDYPGAALPKF